MNTGTLLEISQKTQIPLIDLETYWQTATKEFEGQENADNYPRLVMSAFKQLVLKFYGEKAVRLAGWQVENKNAVFQDAICSSAKKMFHEYQLPESSRAAFMQTLMFASEALEAARNEDEGPGAGADLGAVPTTAIGVLNPLAGDAKMTTFVCKSCGYTGIRKGKICPECGAQL